jgi:DNA-binding beta-propeller fold protein YncE
MSAELRAGTIVTVAGTGEPGWSGDGGAPIAATLNEPKHVAVDAHGNIYIADSENHVVRKIDKITERIGTIAGMATVPVHAHGPMDPISEEEEHDDPLADTGMKQSHAFSQQSDLSGTVRYVVNTATAAKRFCGDGGSALQAQLNFPTAIVVDDDGNVFIADTMNHRVRRVDAISGLITTVAGTGHARYSGDGGPAIAATLNEPAALAVSKQGTLFIADQSNNRIRAVDAQTGMIRTVAGTGTAAYNGDEIPATEASLAGPSGLWLTSDGTLFIADTFNGRIRAIDPATGLIRTVVGDGGEYRYQGPGELASRSLSRPSGIACDTLGNVYVSDSDNHLIRRWNGRNGRLERLVGQGTAEFGGDGGPALGASLNFPFGMAIDRDGQLLVADTFNHRIRAITL